MFITVSLRQFMALSENMGFSSLSAVRALEMRSDGAQLLVSAESPDRSAPIDSTRAIPFVRKRWPAAHPIELGSDVSTIWPCGNANGMG
jgi:hypothetical protein